MSRESRAFGGGIRRVQVGASGRGWYEACSVQTAETFRRAESREGRQSVMTSDLIALMGCCILRPLCKSLPSMSLQARHLP